MQQSEGTELGDPPSADSCETPPPRARFRLSPYTLPGFRTGTRRLHPPRDASYMTTPLL